MGSVGYWKGSGTIASLFSIPFVIGIYYLKLNYLSTYVMLALSTVGAYQLVSNVMPYFSYQDSPCIVIDEVLGMVYTFLGINLNVSVVLWGFVFFRFFDITKILGIRYLEKNIPNPSSIIIDDIVAGLFANCLLRFFNTYEIL